MRLILFVTLAGAALLCARGAQGASFDCAVAKGRIEQMICKTPDLNSFDSQLQAAYEGALDRSRTPATVRTKQQAWLKERDACGDEDCMAGLYQRQIKALQGMSDDPPTCEGSTTIEIEQCQAEYARRADRELGRYVAAVRKRLMEEAKAEPTFGAPMKALAEFDASQAAWAIFRKAECDAVYTWNIAGTIRGTMAQLCLSEATHTRTVQIWGTWLHFADSTPPLMPDPNGGVS